MMWFKACCLGVEVRDGSEDRDRNYSTLLTHANEPGQLHEILMMSCGKVAGHVQQDSCILSVGIEYQPKTLYKGVRGTLSG